MMKKPFFPVLVSLLLLATVADFAYRTGRGHSQQARPRTLPTSNDPDKVYITEGSANYHTADCRFVDTAVTMKRKQAEKAGLTACLKCGG